MPPSLCDSIFEADWVLPVGPDNVALPDHAIAIAGGRIVDVGPRPSISARWRAQDHLALPGHILAPGLVNAHGHLAMTLFRGLADDLPLTTWLTDHIWPLETQWVDPDFVHDGVALGLLEMLTSGTTCFSDMYFFPEVAAASARAAGMRAQIAFPIVRFANAWSRNTDEAFHRGLELHDAYRDEPLIDIAFGPHAPNTVAPADLEKALTLADELEAQIQIHLHENRAEVEEARARLGMTHIEWLSQLGLLIPRLQAVHMTQIDPRELDLVVAGGVSVIHCPNSNLKLGSGHCDTTALRAAGIRVGLGTDGAASNNGLDMFNEMRVAALMAKSVRDDVTAGDAFGMLRMATLGGAEALGLDDRIGSLEPGKLADVIAVDAGSAAMAPLHRPESQLVYTAAGAHVRHVWIGGQRVVADYEARTLERSAVLADAGRWIDRLEREPRRPLQRVPGGSDRAE